jgi:GT2 family glycosyltransferase
MAESLSISGYVPFFNNGATVLQAVDSLRGQEPPFLEVFALDDGSTDGGADKLVGAGVRVIRQPRNLGRGAARHRAMQEARGEFVLCCDATNTLPPDFAAASLRWFDDPKVAAVFGLIADPTPRGAVGRWRARHLFKADAAHAVTHNARLITYGTMVRASHVRSVGGFSEALRHSEDDDLGRRLLEAGFDVVCDPALRVCANIDNTLGQVLERYWRWYAGREESFGLRAYLRSVWYSLRTMAWSDLRQGDPLAGGISLLVPHYQLIKRLGRMKA